MKVYRSKINELYYILCPACNVTHAFSDGHEFNGDYINPTIKGSLGWTGEVDQKIIYCHSIVTNGKIRFVEDSQHEFRGQTLELPKII